MKLSIVRGTTNTFNILIKDPDGNPYFLGDGEVLRFGIKRSPENQHIDVEKEVTSEALRNGVYPVKLSPEDTKDLSCCKYCYDVGLQSGDDYYMVIPCSTLEITSNVTKKAVIADG